MRPPGWGISSVHVRAAAGLGHGGNTREGEKQMTLREVQEIELIGFGVLLQSRKIREKEVSRQL